MAHLTDYQKYICDELYHSLVGNDLSCIMLRGEHGCGKSYILCSIPDMFVEGWKVLYLTGTGQTHQPYSTWYSHESFLMKKRSRFALQNVTLGFPGSPIPHILPLELGVSINHSISGLSSTEVSLLTEIQKEMHGAKHILVIADDYELWDISSMDFLEKLLYFGDSLLSANVHCILSIAQNIIDRLYHCLPFG